MTYNFDTGDGRIDALVRLLLLIYVFTIYPIVVAIGLIAGLLWMIIDVLAQLWHGDERYTLFNRDGILLGGLLALFRWWMVQLEYIVGLRTHFPVLPQRSYKS